MSSEATRQPAILLGFLARRRTPTPQWLNAGQVSEVSNVSIDSCEAVGFPGENRFALHDSIEVALDRCESPGDVQVFAYSVLPVEYDEDGERRVQVAGADSTLPVSGWSRVGYDVVASEGDWSVGAWCSPLCCNSVAGQVPTNERCLIDDVNDAIALARRFASGDIAVEPGPFFVVEVATQPDARHRHAAHIEHLPSA